MAVVSLLGRNGAGRSTAMKAVMGLVPPSAGSIQLGGRGLTGLRPYRISRAGVGLFRRSVKYSPTSASRKPAHGAASGD